LETLVPLELVLKAELVVLVGEFEEVQQLGTGLHDGEGRRLGVVNEDGDTAVGIQAEKPFLLLLVGADVDDGCRPLRVVGVGEFFKKDLHFLSIGRRLGDEVEAFGVLDLIRRLSNVEMFGHGQGCCLVTWVEECEIETVWEEKIGDAVEDVVLQAEDDTKYKNQAWDEVLFAGECGHRNFDFSASLLSERGAIGGLSSMECLHDAVMMHPTSLGLFALFTLRMP
jgi:hypothetical protein